MTKTSAPSCLFILGDNAANNVHYEAVWREVQDRRRDPPSPRFRWQQTTDFTDVTDKSKSRTILIVAE